MEKWEGCEKTWLYTKSRGDNEASGRIGPLRSNAPGWWACHSNYGSDEPPIEVYMLAIPNEAASLEVAKEAARQRMLIGLLEEDYGTSYSYPDIDYL